MSVSTVSAPSQTCLRTPPARLSRTPSPRRTPSRRSTAAPTSRRCAPSIRPPDDPATVAKVDELRKRLADMKARFDAGRWKETLKDAPGIVLRARTIGYQPLMAESLWLTGLIYAIANDRASGERALVEAYRLADVSRHDDVRAEVATISCIRCRKPRRTFRATPCSWSETATAVLQRLGGHELLRAWLLNNLGCAYFVHRDTEAGVACAEGGIGAQAEGFLVLTIRTSVCPKAIWATS